jgi:hypothetical protein
MTTDILLAAIPTPTDADCLDLGALFAPLQREEIELMIVKLLNKYPAEAGWIVQVSRTMPTTTTRHSEWKVYQACRAVCTPRTCRAHSSPQSA